MSLVITLDNFILLEKGSNSEIYLNIGVCQQQNLILKTVDTNHTKEANHLLNQFQILSSLSHPNIIKPIALKQNFPFLGINKHVIILNYAKHRSLLDFIKTGVKLTISQIRRLFKDICEAVLHLHSNNIVHRDLKLENILVFQDQNQQVSVKISDFGFADKFYSQTEKTIKLYNTYKGTRRGYMAPEIHTVFETKIEYDARKTDVFCLGVMLFSMIFKKLPFEYATKQNNIYKFISESNFEKFWKCHSKELLKKQYDNIEFMENDLKDLLNRLFSFNPNQRPEMKDIMNHNWMKGQTESISVT